MVYVKCFYIDQSFNLGGTSFLWKGIDKCSNRKWKFLRKQETKSDCLLSEKAFWFLEVWPGLWRKDGHEIGRRKTGSSQGEQQLRGRRVSEQDQGVTGQRTQAIRDWARVSAGERWGQDWALSSNGSARLRNFPGRHLKMFQWWFPC